MDRNWVKTYGFCIMLDIFLSPKMVTYSLEARIARQNALLSFYFWITVWHYHLWVIICRYVTFIYSYLIVPYLNEVTIDECYLIQSFYLFAVYIRIPCCLLSYYDVKIQTTCFLICAASNQNILFIMGYASCIQDIKEVTFKL